MVNLEIAFPEMSATQKEALGRESLCQTATTLMEVPLMWEWPVRRCLDLIREVEGEHLLKEALESGEGLILLAPHLGNWELAGLFYSSHYKMFSLYAPPKQPEFEQYMVDVRSRHGATLVTGDRRGIVKLIQALKDGGVVGILPDQCPTQAGWVNASFFGRETRTMTLATRLQQKSGARILATFAERLPGHRGFRMVIQECPEGITSADSVVAATAMNQVVEQLVSRCPSQYQWEYKRFRYGPANLANPYKPPKSKDRDDSVQIDKSE